MARAKNSFLLVGRQAAVIARIIVLTGASSVPQPVASALHRDDFGVMEKAIQDGGGGRNVVKELPPFFDGPVGGHEGGAGFITPHDDLQKNLPGFGWQDFESHVVNLQEVGLEIAGHGPVQLRRRLISLEFTDQVKDRAVDHLEAGFNEVVGGLPDLYEVWYELTGTRKGQVEAEIRRPGIVQK